MLKSITGKFSKTNVKPKKKKQKQKKIMIIDFVFARSFSFLRNHLRLRCIHISVLVILYINVCFFNCGSFLEVLRKRSRQSVEPLLLDIYCGLRIKNNFCHDRLIKTAHSCKEKTNLYRNKY